MGDRRHRAAGGAVGADCVCGAPGAALRAHAGGVRARRSACGVRASAPGNLGKQQAMNIDLLIKMTNEIGEFFAGTTDADAAARDVANHLKRYWDPRMREQMPKYYQERSGAG